MKHQGKKEVWSIERTGATFEERPCDIDRISVFVLSGLYG
jgi:hypothetical protein